MLLTCASALPRAVANASPRAHAPARWSLLLLLLFLPLLGWGQIATYTIAGSGNDVTSLNASAKDANVTVSPLTKVGITSTSSSGNFRGNQWPAANALDESKRIEFTVTPDAGFALSLTSLTYGVGSSNTGPATYEWRSSVDNFAAPIGSSFSKTSAPAGSSLNLGTAFSNVTSAVTFRLFGYSASGASGTGGLAGDLVINGTVAPTGPITPTLTTISPATEVAGSAGFTLTAAGTGFVNGAQVYFNGAALVTTFNSATELTAAVPASAIATPGTYPVTVKNTAGGTASNIRNFTVSAATANPTIALAQGATPVANGGTFSGFAATTVGSSSSVTFTISNASADPLTLGNFNFTGSDFALSTPKPTTVAAGGSTTFGVQFAPSASGPRPGSVSIVNNSASNNPYVINFSGVGTNPAPTISSLAPSTGATGSTVATLTIVGTNFVSGATVSFGGTSYTPATLTATQLTVSNVAVPGTAGSVNVTVTNPAPGGGTSAAAVFTAMAPVSGLFEDFETGTKSVSGYATGKRRRWRVGDMAICHDALLGPTTADQTASSGAAPRSRRSMRNGAISMQTN